MPSLLDFCLEALFCLSLIGSIVGLLYRREIKRLRRSTTPRVTQSALDQAHRIDHAMHSEDSLPCDVEAR